MKITEAMKEVFHSDLAWITKNNVLQWLTLCGCALVSFGPLLATIWYGFVLVPQTPWSIQGAISVPSAIWAFYWLRIFGKWWPF